jgi:hypothetical protein
MNKKEHLINSLRIAIDSLQNGIIKYDWNEQCSCNAGIVSQAVLGISINELQKLRKTAFDKLEKHNFQKHGNEILYNGQTGRQIHTEIHSKADT